MKTRPKICELVVLGTLLFAGITTSSHNRRVQRQTCSPKRFPELLMNQERGFGACVSGKRRHDIPVIPSDEHEPVPSHEVSPSVSSSDTATTPPPSPPSETTQSPPSIPTEPPVTPAIPSSTSESPVKIAAAQLPLVVNKSEPDDAAEPEPPEPIVPFEEWKTQKLQQQKTKKPARPVILVNQEGVGLVPGGGNGERTEGGKGAVGSGGAADPLPEIVVETQRNYASKECGAKILLTNAETQHSGAVLKEKERDEYLLNPCQTEGRKFFIIELCEIIQPTLFELANFELFSSSPKEFLVRGSERYPSTEWTLLGQWTAEDLRKIQSFQITNRIYAKYVKVELLSHYGSEHFCPVSMVRVAGISMVDEFEGMSNDEEEEEEEAETPSSPVEQNPPPTSPAPQTAGEDVSPKEEINDTKSNGIIDTAKETVINIAKGVSKVLVGEKKDEETKQNLNSSHCAHEMEIYLRAYKPWLANCYSCGQQALEDGKRYCSKICGLFAPGALQINSVEVDWTTGESSLPAEPKIDSDFTHHKPSKVTGTLNSSNQPSSTHSSHKDESSPKAAVTPKEPTRSGTTPSEDSKQLQQMRLVDSGPTSAPIPRIHTFFNLISELKAAKLKRQIEEAAKRPPPAAPVPRSGPLPAAVISHLPGSSMNQKESVFHRLNNRIKALEQNISLSSQYLSELSCQYKRQMEDIQKQYERASRLANLTRKEAEERWRQQDSELRLWRTRARDLQHLSHLLRQQHSFWQAQAWQYIVCGAVAQLFLVLLICLCCMGLSEHRLDSKVRRCLAKQLRYVQGDFNGSLTNGHCVRPSQSGLRHETESWGTQTDDRSFIEIKDISGVPTGLSEFSRAGKHAPIRESENSGDASELDLFPRPIFAGACSDFYSSQSSSAPVGVSGRTPQREVQKWTGVKKKKKNPGSRPLRKEDSEHRIPKTKLSASSGLLKPEKTIHSQPSSTSLHSYNLFSLLRNSPEKEARQGPRSE